MSGNKSKIIAFNYFGGKFTWIEYLYRYFPEGFTHLVDLFAGSMVVSINYPGKVIKTANEINSDITNFFEVLRNHEDDLIRLLLLTPCSLQEYDNCREYSDDNIEQARRFYVRVRQSFFGLGCQRQNKGWHMAKKKVLAQGGETALRSMLASCAPGVAVLNIDNGYGAACAAARVLAALYPQARSETAG